MIHIQVRINGKIRAREVLVIGPEGGKLGLLKIEEALAKAREHGLDLIEVAPGAHPPVCKILDYGKYRYQQAKHDRDTRKHGSASKVKEVKLRPNIAAHDYLTKIRNAEAFLDKGMKVKLTLNFRGREMQHTGLGRDLVHRVCNDLNHVAHVESDPKLLGRAIVAMLVPLPANKRVRKYTDAHSLPSEADEEDTEPTLKTRSESSADSTAPQKK